MYTVTAENGTTKDWIVTVTISTPLSDAKEITSFVFPGQTGTSVFNSTGTAISVNLPFGTPITAVTPTITISPKAAISPSGSQDFSSSVTYTITAENGTTKTVVVTVTVAPGSNAKNITAFTIPGQVGASTINNSTRTVTLSVPNATNVTSLTPSIQVSAGASISNLGQVRNFTNPVNYTVTAENQTTVIWKVNVTKLPPPVVSVTGVRINNKSTTQLPYGGTLQLSASVLPANATNDGITWGFNTINGQGKVNITQNGFITVPNSAAQGVVEIIIRSAEDATIFDKYQIRIYASPPVLLSDGRYYTKPGNSITLEISAGGNQGGTLRVNVTATGTGSIPLNRTYNWTARNGIPGGLQKVSFQMPPNGFTTITGVITPVGGSTGEVATIVIVDGSSRKTISLNSN